MDSTHHPPVTVSVITYNSSKTVVETLDSIYGQTYPNLELVISDDCSTDDTVSICRNWIEKHPDRFARTELIVSTENTGVSANLNRAWNACTTEWDKDIAGDDILFPHCIQDYMAFVKGHPDAVVVFSRINRFKCSKGNKVWVDDSWHDYRFFDMDPVDQRRFLVFNSGHIPTCSCFYNLKAIKERGFMHDERIPLLEDDPKWIVFSKMGIRFDFLDQTTVGYRLDQGSLTSGVVSPKYFQSRLLFYLYYYLDEIKCESDRDTIYNLICDEVINRGYLKAYQHYVRISDSWDYKVGRFLLSPFHKLKDLILQIRGKHE